MYRSRAAVALSMLMVLGAIVFGTSAAWAGGSIAFSVDKAHGDSGRDKAGIANEGPDGTYAGEQSKLRAYPADEVPTDAIENAQATFQSFKTSTRRAGQWSPIGPTRKAQYPAVLDQFLFDGAPYTASGRVTALAIAPSCKAGEEEQGQCRLYVGAAGGGIWRTDNALSEKAKWTFLTGALGSNAIGSILLDPSDASGNTIYIGTGEPNASGDSEAGVGVYKSTNGGRTWTLVPGSDMFWQRSIGQMALDNAGNLLVPVASGVRGIASTGGASSSGNAAHPLVLRGLYRQTGSTFTRIFTAPGPTRGSTTVEADPTHAGVIYVNAFQQGIWRSSDNGVTFAQIFTPKDPTVAGSATDRSEFDVTTLAGGATRMYVGEGAGGGAVKSSFWRSDNADTAATFAQMGGAQTANYCTSQCWYDNYTFTPKGAPDVVYLGGSFDYGQVQGKSNARAVLLSTDGGATWSDMTLDGGRPHAAGMHPDQHALVTVPGKPFEFIAGSDGGVIRSDGRFANISFKCDLRGLITAAETTYCKSLLWRVPNELITMNDGLNTLQFQSLSVSAQRPKSLLQGGTQDNGTFQYNGSPQVWPQIIYGDGGQSGFNTANDRLRFNTFTGQANDVNFRNGDPTAWVVATGPIVSSPEGSYFYPPVIADPNKAVAGSIFQGSFSVWRTQDWGGNQAFLEANCPEFTTSAADPGCGDFVIIGDGAPSTRLTSAAWGTNKAGGAVSSIARAPQNTGTMWASTGAGRLFVTDNANAAAGAVHWTRLDTGVANAPTRFISSIYVDPADANHVWVSYSGYSVNNPTQPGHIFEVTRTTPTTATWVDRTYNLADLPATAIVRDDLTGDLYAGTDFAVFRLASGATSWTMTTGMPMAEVAGLTIVPGARVLYAATHGLGAWVMDLARVTETDDGDHEDQRAGD